METVTMNSNDCQVKNAKALLWYLDQGLPVFPVCPDLKKPLVSWKSYQTQIPTIAEVKQWLAKFSAFNVGFACGQVSDTTIVDCDSKEAIDRIDGYLPDSLEMPMVGTPRGGNHFYFAYTEGLKNWTGVFPGVDIRTHGGQALLPPSANKHGSYKWFEGLRIDQVQRPVMPEKLRRNIQAAMIKNTVLPTNAYGAAALAGELALLAAATKGGRNSQLNKSAHVLGQLVAGNEIDAVQVRSTLLAVALSIGLTNQEATATIESGMSSGQRKPRSAGEAMRRTSNVTSDKKRARISIIRS